VAAGEGDSGQADSGQADEELFYLKQDGRIVFTNTPAASARPVPIVERTRTPVTRSVLPDTIYDPFIERVAQEYRLSPGLIKAVALVESGFDPHAVSPKGAQGLMQLMPGTASDYGVDDAFDPLQNLRAGSAHLRRLLDEFDGDLTLALAAYNAGASTVRRHGGVPDYAETKEYLRRVRARLGQDPAARRRSSAGVSPRPSVRLVMQPDGSVLLAN
jgi:soluble lytic murein transglycosylase-like protein